MNRVFLSIISMVVVAFVNTYAAGQRFEAEAAVVDENAVVKVADDKASGGFYINMKEGALTCKVTTESAGFYSLWAMYSQPGDTNGKIQNLSVNGVSTGQISFPKIDSLTLIKASAKISLKAGQNTIEITKSWGWVNIDFVEIVPYVATPFTIANMPVTPNASKNTVKMYTFLKEQFQKKVISGVMTNRVMQNDGLNTPMTVDNQIELAWIDSVSGKTPALLGLDFMHATGKNSESGWHTGYTDATITLAEEMFKRGGIPAYCWHWKDPTGSAEVFYSPSASGQTPTEFDLTKAFSDPPTYQKFNTESTEYKDIVKDIDKIALHLKKLADKDIPVLWRPVHEASGKWFWWGYRGAKPCKALYRLIFDRFTREHKLTNLIWVWTSDEAADALEWYPGDDCVDIVGRDFYYYPREANHGSLAASFEKLKELFGGKKIITLSENGSVPFPDDMKNDGAGWSYFMPWYGDYTMDGWAHDNTAADWKKILASDYVLTLDEMPGWEKYTVSVGKQSPVQQTVPFSIRSNADGYLEVSTEHGLPHAVTVYSLGGKLIKELAPAHVKPTGSSYPLTNMANGTYLVKVRYCRTVYTHSIVHSERHYMTN